MSSKNTSSTIARLLVQLAHLGIAVVAKDNRISLKPASRLSPDYLSYISLCKPELMVLLQDPRRRWRAQAQELIRNAPANDHEDMLDLFDEREAIACVDGELDDHHAGQVAYRALLKNLRQYSNPITPS